MQYHAATAGEYDWQVFWYEKNLQDDIVAVYSDSGTKLISYTYDVLGATSLPPTTMPELLRKPWIIRLRIEVITTIRI